MTRVGIVGCGTIGSALARAIEHDHAKTARVVALTDEQRAPALHLQRQLASHPPMVSLPELIRRSDVVVEAASVAVAARVARLALMAHRDVLIMSSGGLVTSDAWRRAAQRSRGRLHVPSGALCGLDGVKAMAMGTIRRIQLTTRKAPRALAAAPFVQTRHLVLERLKRPRVLFDGSPADAVKAFPQNTNVAATLALASGQGRASTRVRVIADPSVRMNIHELEVEGDCGRIRCRVESRPSFANPKTSELAVRSAMATLAQLFEPIRIGT